jgi:hypothetical protein
MMRLNWPVVSALLVDAFCWMAVVRVALFVLR